MTETVVDPRVALEEVAAALTKLQLSGQRVDVRFGSVMTDHGYVLPNEDGTWSAKLKVGDAPAWWGGSVAPNDDDDE